MAKIDVVMPQMGESITTGTITKWHKKVGDQVEIDELLLEISTDKVESEIPAPSKGYIAQLLYPEGATVDVGKVIAVITSEAVAQGTVPTAAPAILQATDSSAAQPMRTTAPVVAPVVQTASADVGFLSPLVRKMVQELGISPNELQGIEGTGSAGRISKKDLEQYLSQKTAAQKTSSATSTVTPNTAANISTNSTNSGRVEIIPMDNMRKAIAKNMVESKRQVPHVNSIGEVDMAHLVAFRESFKDTFEKQEGFKLTYSPFIIRALILALKDYPLVNASMDEEQSQIIVKKDINLGVAVAVPGNGLVVPVIKNADTLNMLGLCRALQQLAIKARQRKLTADDISGGTFTFTNVGSFGTLMATPIILRPQLGIYASGVIKKRPVVVGEDSIAIRPMMYGTHTYDHRLVDGELGGKFLEAVHQHLSTMNPKDLF